jgi:hypothetical protein
LFFIVVGKINTALLTSETLFILLFTPPDSDKLPQAQQRFFKLFHKQKKFSETVFTKLSCKSRPLWITAVFTNYFSVLYLK